MSDKITDVYNALFANDEPLPVPAWTQGEFVTVHFMEYGTLACIPIDIYHNLIATARLATNYRAQVDILKTELGQQ